MCGIAGIIGGREVVQRALPTMLHAQAHRGPDDQGHSELPFGGRWLGLGHRRLSIIDLSAAGHQPMVDRASGSQIIFNGEIYNFASLRRELEDLGQRFAGHSDTEVLLYGLSRWGPDYTRRLEGMFAFAFYDARDGSLLLARDSLGIKPLYVAQVGENLLFASEVRGLLASGLIAREVDQQALAGLLAYGSVQQPSTIIKDITSFPPGSWQVFRPEPGRSDRAATRFWSFPSVDHTMAEPHTLEALRSTLDDAVRDHLVADVPVGVFLSSGLDSTIVAGLAARHTPHLRSFTVGFADQPDMSELALARETAGQFGLNHTEIEINGPQAQEVAQAWLDSLDQPSLDGLNVYLISKVIRSQGIVVALSGQGGDELFGGYASFDQVPRLHTTLRRMAWVPAPLRAGAVRLAAVGRSSAVREKLADMARTSGGVIELCLQRRRAMSDAQIASLGLTPDRLNLSSSYLRPEALAELRTNGDMIATISEIESRFYQANTLLRDSDANGMAHSLEIRVPILDQRMLNLAYQIPGRVRLPSGRANKHLLRVAFGSLLRSDLLEQKKRGFTLPIRRWMTGPLRELCEASLSTLRSSGLLESQGIDLIWSTFLREPETPMWSRAFTLVVLGHYLKRAGIA